MFRAAAPEPQDLRECVGFTGLGGGTGIASPMGMGDTSPIPCTSTRRVVRVLIVDDNEVLARSLTRMLSRALVAAESECDPRRAVQRICGGERFDMVVCDLRLPHMSGHDVLATIRTHYAGRLDLPKLVVMSGDENQIASEIQFGAVGLAKPFRAELLRSLLADIEVREVV